MVQGLPGSIVFFLYMIYILRVAEKRGVSRGVKQG
jgi:hypothetical protein